MTTVAINTFRLRRGVGAEEFETFSAQLDRPTCLAFDVVLGFDVYIVDPADESGVDVVEIMTVASWPNWEQIRDTAAELAPVVQRFGELVDPDSVSTLLTRKSTLPQEI